MRFLALLVVVGALAASCGSDANNELVDGPIEDSGECDRDEFAGLWQSPRAAGTEPLAENDGVGNEGGIGVVALTLSAEEPQLRSGDTIEVFDSWLCTSSTIVGISFSGEERDIATINPDGTLTYQELTLTKAQEG